MIRSPARTGRTAQTGQIQCSGIQARRQHRRGPSKIKVKLAAQIVLVQRRMHPTRGKHLGFGQGHISSQRHLTPQTGWQRGHIHPQRRRERRAIRNVRIYPTLQLRLRRPAPFKPQLATLCGKSSHNRRHGAFQQVTQIANFTGQGQRFGPVSHGQIKGPSPVVFGPSQIHDQIAQADIRAGPVINIAKLTVGDQCPIQRQGQRVRTPCRLPRSRDTGHACIPVHTPVGSTFQHDIRGNRLKPGNTHLSREQGNKVYPDF